MRFVPASTLIAAALAFGCAQAQTVLLNDSFDAENGGKGAGVYSGFANFVAADIDLLGPGYFFHLCQSAGGSTPCVDMEGNGNGSLTTRTAYAFGPGRATLQFDLAGDQRSATGNAVTVSLVSVGGASLFSETFTLAANAPFATYTRSVDVADAVSARLRFASSGRADSYGMLLDNVSLSVTAVPEPSAALMLAAGLATMAAVTRRRLARRA